MIPLVKPLIGIEEKRLVNEVLESGTLAQGSYVKDFEENFAAYHESKYGVATSSGTAALHVALKSLDIGPGDKVITTPFSFIATANAILYAQAIPIFSDIDLDNYNLSPESLLEALQKHPDAKAVIVVHLYGHPAKMPEIMEIARTHNLLVIEDCAQAHGASINGRKVGTFGHAGAFSFYPTKNMTCGEGGILLSQDKKLADKARVLINHGQMIKYQHDLLGFNYRMTNVHAAIGLAQLQKLPEFNRKRKDTANRYSAEINNSLIKKPQCLQGFEHVYHQYTVEVDNRSKFIAYLQEKGIGYGIHYPKTIPDQPLYQGKDIKAHIPNAQKSAERVVSIPIYPGLLKEELDYIITSLQNYRV